MRFSRPTLAALLAATLGLLACEGTQAATARGDLGLGDQGARAADFAPHGWGVEQQASGDISRDGIPDLAFILRKNDPAGLIARDGYELENINPRIIGVAVGGSGHFTLVGIDRQLIPTREADGLNMDDPLNNDAMTIADGVLAIQIDLFMNMGGADAGPYIFKYRHQDGAVRLIGFDHTNVQRMSGETAALSANLLTGRVITETGTIDSDATTRAESRTALRAPPMDQVGDAFAFEYDKLAAQ